MQKHDNQVVFSVAFVCAFMTIRNSDAPQGLSGHAADNDNAWPALAEVQGSLVIEARGEWWEALLKMLIAVCRFHL